MLRPRAAVCITTASAFTVPSLLDARCLNTQSMCVRVSCVSVFLCTLAMRAVFLEVLHVFLEVGIGKPSSSLPHFWKLTFAAATSSFSRCLTAVSSWHLLLPATPLAACLLATSSLSSRAARLDCLIKMAQTLNYVGTQ